MLRHEEGMCTRRQGQESEAIIAVLDQRGTGARGAAQHAAHARPALDVVQLRACWQVFQHLCDTRVDGRVCPGGHDVADANAAWRKEVRVPLGGWLACKLSVL